MQVFQQNISMIINNVYALTRPSSAWTLGEAVAWQNTTQRCSTSGQLVVKTTQISNIGQPTKYSNKIYNIVFNA